MPKPRYMTFTKTKSSTSPFCYSVAAVYNWITTLKGEKGQDDETYLPNHEVILRDHHLHDFRVLMEFYMCILQAIGEWNRIHRASRQGSHSAWGMFKETNRYRLWLAAESLFPCSHPRRSHRSIGKTFRVIGVPGEPSPFVPRPARTLPPFCQPQKHANGHHITRVQTHCGGGVSLVMSVIPLRAANDE